MSWSRFDDGYDEHEKIQAAWFAFPPNPVGLHVLATTACNRWGSDGVIRERWLEFMLPHKRRRADVLAECVTVGLFERLPAGKSRVLMDGDGNEIAVGPFREDRYVVHDFLDRHESSVQRRARLDADAERKRKARSGGTPKTVPADSGGTPPRPPANGRQRDQRQFEDRCEQYGQQHFADLSDPRAAVRQAVTFGKAQTHDEIVAFVDEHFRGAAAA